MKVALATFPRSGNSAIRKLIHNITGIPVGSSVKLMNPAVMNLLMSGLKGDSLIDDCFIIKTHYPLPYDV
jgi:hypothetical protein